MTNSEIDRRNVRDIVRGGISKGDNGGALEDRFVLTEFGKELLEKAAKEEDWNQYSDLVKNLTTSGGSGAPFEDRNLTITENSDDYVDPIRRGSNLF